MAKIGRNHPCPCGSGRKHKHCCLVMRRVAGEKSETDQAGQMKISLVTEIEKVQQAALEGKEHFHELGVFLFFSNSAGDAWMLEVTQSDGVQLAEAGRALQVPIDENPDTIEVDWSHVYAIRDRRFYLTDYADDSEQLMADAPTQQIHAAIRRIRKNCSPQLLKQVHVEQERTGGGACH